MGEIWKNIDGFPGYQVSNFGQVRSFWRAGCSGKGRKSRIINESKVLKFGFSGPKRNYHFVNLRLGGFSFARHIHRLVWLAFNGDIPEKLEIDHIDRNPRNNSLENLRLATRTQNLRNSKRRKDSKSQFSGVKYHKRSRTWQARIKINGKEKSCGYYKTEEEAAHGRDQALRKHLTEEELAFCRFNFNQQ